MFNRTHTLLLLFILILSFGLGLWLYERTDFSDLTLSQENFLSLVGEPLDYITTSELEIFTGKEDTYYLQDQDFSCLINNNGSQTFSPLLKARIEAYFVSNEGTKKIEIMDSRARGSFLWWVSLLDLLIHMPPRFNRNIDESTAYAIAYSIGTPGNLQPNFRTLYEYSFNKYIEKGADLIDGKNIDPSEVQDRYELISDILGTQPPDNEIELIDAMFKEATNLGTHSKKHPAAMSMVKKYLCNRLRLDRSEVSFASIIPTYTNWVLSGRPID